MTNRVVFGCDAGQTGGIAIFCDGEPTDVQDMPTYARKAGGEEVNCAALAEMLRVVIRLNPGAVFSACVEAVNAMPKQGVTSSFRFGESFGRLIGVLHALSIPTMMVTPVRWKKTAGLIGTEKDVARTLAVQRWPHLQHLLKLKKHGGRADALWIGLYGVGQS